jgi:hypothetical protein
MNIIFGRKPDLRAAASPSPLSPVTGSDCSTVLNGKKSEA